MGRSCRVKITVTIHRLSRLIHFSFPFSRRRRVSWEETLHGAETRRGWKRELRCAIGSSTRPHGPPPRVRQFDVLIYQLVSLREESSLVPGISIPPQLPLITDSSVFHTRSNRDRIPLPRHLFRSSCLYQKYFNPSKDEG